MDFHENKSIISTLKKEDHHKHMSGEIQKCLVYENFFHSYESLSPEQKMEKTQKQSHQWGQK